MCLVWFGFFLLLCIEKVSIKSSWKDEEARISDTIWGKERNEDESSQWMKIKM